LLTHRDVVPLIATDVAILNHPAIGPRLRAQNQQLHSLLTAPDTSVAARLRAEAALGATRRPPRARPPPPDPRAPARPPQPRPPAPPHRRRHRHPPTQPALPRRGTPTGYP